MKWNVSGAWKADGETAQMDVDAPNQRAAESIAATRGMMVESCIPAAAEAIPLHYSATSAAAGPRVQTVQQTAKVWKLAQLIGVLACIASVVTIGVALNTKPKPTGGPDVTAALGILGLLGGLILFAVGRIFAWWFHG